MPQIVSSIDFNDYFNGAPIPFVGSNITSLATAFTPFGKSIQKSYRFIVTFFPNLKFLTNPVHAQLYARIGPMPLIRAFHLVSIAIPQYTFTKDTQYYGPVPRSFPELKYDGFEVRMVFEEDDKGTCGNFINWMQRAVMDPTTGTYTAPDAVKIPFIGVVTENDFGMPIGAYTLHDCFYLSSSGSEFDYGTNSAVRYEVTFNCDIINSFFPIASSFQKLTSLILG